MCGKNSGSLAHGRHVECKEAVYMDPFAVFEEKFSQRIPPRPHKVLGLYLASAHLSILRALLNVLHELLLLVFELDPFAIEFSLGFFQGALMFAEAFLRGHAFAEGPFDDLVELRNV